MHDNMTRLPVFLTQLVTSSAWRRSSLGVVRDLYMISLEIQARLQRSTLNLLPMHR
jgi:hypothetical protein